MYGKLYEKSKSKINSKVDTSRYDQIGYNNTSTKL